MEASPLVQQARPSFQPKIARLYEELFVAEEEHSPGYWAEFFLLKPDTASLQQKLDSVSADELLQHQDESQQLFMHAVEAIKSQHAPSDEVALDTLTVYLTAVLSKRYTNPSSDIITVLTGLNEVDAIFLDFANSIESSIRKGRTQSVRRKAIRAALSLASGAYQTSLVSYFSHRDLFPALVKYTQDTESAEDVLEPFMLLGLLANYNKFEYRNPYRLRMEDFVNEDSTTRYAAGIGQVLAKVRDQYLDVQEDQAETAWSLANTLSSIGLSVLAPIKAISPATPSEDDLKAQFALLPDARIAVLLGVYDFVSANNLFCFKLLSDPSDPTRHGPAFSSFMSLASYVNHHASRSARAASYGLMSMIILRIIVEDPGLCKRLCDPNVKVQVQLCRQKQPALPPTNSPRPGVCQVLDVCVDTINHNLRKRLDLDLYVASVHVIHRLLVCMSQNRIHLPYHWPQLWQALLALVRFLQSFSDALNAHSSALLTLLTPLTKVLALSIAAGVQFLPDSGSHDDLFYKLVECRPVLEKLRDTYRLNDTNSAISVILTTSAHFHGLLESKGLMSRALSTKEVTRVVRSGFESLEVPDISKFGVENFQQWRESDEKATVKKMARVAVDDAKHFLMEH